MKRIKLAKLSNRSGARLIEEFISENNGKRISLRKSNSSTEILNSNNLLHIKLTAFEGKS